MVWVLICKMKDILLHRYNSNPDKYLFIIGIKNILIVDFHKLLNIYHLILNKNLISM